MSRRRTLSVACLGGLVAWAVIAAPVSASHHGAGVPDEIALQVSYQQAPVAGVLGQVVVRALLDNNQPAAGVSVEFLRHVDFLGPRLISLGSVVTDASGYARMAVEARESTLHILARTSESDEYLPAETDASMNVPAVPGAGPGIPTTDDSQPNLAVLAGVMPPLLAVGALSVWLFLLGLIAATVISIRRGQPSFPTRKEGSS